MNEKFIRGVLSSGTDEEIANRYTRSQLTEMFISIYECKPMSGKTKLSIVQTMRGYYFTMDRAKALLGGK